MIVFWPGDQGWNFLESWQGSHCTPSPGGVSVGSDAPSSRSMRLASAPPPEAHLNSQVSILPCRGTKLSQFLH